MARDVLIRLKKLSTTGKVPANAAVRFEPTVLRADADGYILDDYFDAVMVDGEATVTDLPETDLNWAYKVQIRGHGRGAGLKQVYATWYVHLPAGEGTVNFEDLPRIDPKTLTPVNDPDPAWVDAVTAVFNDSVSTAVEPAMVTAVDDESSEFRARLNAASALGKAMLDPSKRYAQMSCVIRNTGAPNYWQVIDDAGHVPVNVSSVGTTDLIVRINYAMQGAKVINAFAVTDETLAKAGYFCGPSVGTGGLDIYLSRQGISDYVSYDAATSTWTSQEGIFTPTWVAASSTLNMAHPAIDGFSLSATPHRTNIAVTTGPGGMTTTNTAVQFRNPDGSLITTPTADIKFYVSRHGSVTINPKTAPGDSANIWVQALVELP